ncbi:unnamed protein product [Bursaphelenchus okinawaensis]|uniref:Sulfhydryl oxidase n=1 Tax=Bursaphelenchus okinawaensis TaxID=465554 RepID=A0A811KSK1_9BILA|nr:unnamed protein product [Bursaphelenchus okinawaensis]CAG9111388.1 unnamed protein product [Bursaphelenchus okinawaensis]
MILRWCSGIFFLLLFTDSTALKSSFTYHPQGSNTLLYSPGLEPIMHLDQVTFDETIFDMNKKNSFLVEFYADWCGHCRAFAPYFKEFASLVSNWNEVTIVAAINCADSFNADICRKNGITYFPMVKYFPRVASNYAEGQLLDPSHSATNLRDQLASKVTNEYSVRRYPEWPNFSYVDVTGNTKFEDLWNGVLPQAKYMTIVFEQYDSVAAQAMLDLWPYRNHVGVRRAMGNSPLVQMLHIANFPYVALFKRGNQQSIFMSPYGYTTLQDIMARADPNERVTRPPVITTTTPKPENLVNCEKNPEKCQTMYFASETDMLKAMRQALVDEIIRTNDFVNGQNFTNLQNFVGLLADHFPTVSYANGLQRRALKRSTSVSLKKSAAAKEIFDQLRKMLDTKPGKISIKEWKTTFEGLEDRYGKPFPTDSDWQHCRGSTGQYRGYTCGLWTTFHTLTIHTYMDTIKAKGLKPITPLKHIQGWVNSFFGCEDCKQHFMQMTTEKFPMTEDRVKHSHDMFMYLWRAHNIVNNRLHGDSTEDPQFLKYQFPPFFLCPTCHAGGQFSRRKVRNFLLRYYVNIRPYHRVH